MFTVSPTFSWLSSIFGDSFVEPLYTVTADGSFGKVKSPCWPLSTIVSPVIDFTLYAKSTLCTSFCAGTAVLSTTVVLSFTVVLVLFVFFEFSFINPVLWHT